MAAKANYADMLTTVDEDSTSAFSDCNSDRSGEFPTASSSNRRLLIACASENSDEFIRNLVLKLESCSIEEQKQATMEIRLLAKHKQENRLKIAKSGAIKPLVSLMSCKDLQLEEYVVTAILNLSLCDENKEIIVSSGAVKALIESLERGTATTKENAACALLRLAQSEEQKLGGARAPPIYQILPSLLIMFLRFYSSPKMALFRLVPNVFLVGVTNIALCHWASLRFAFGVWSHLLCILFGRAWWWCISFSRVSSRPLRRVFSVLLCMVMGLWPRTRLLCSWWWLSWTGGGLGCMLFVILIYFRV